MNHPFLLTILFAGVATASFTRTGRSMALLSVAGTGSPESESPVDNPRKVVQVGSATIGANGGSLTSNDQKLTLRILPGSFAKEETISLEAIDNKAPNGQGQSYRIHSSAPASKPFSLCWKVNKELIRVAQHKKLAIAYLDEQRQWHANKKMTIDEKDTTICLDLKHGRSADIALICEYILMPSIDGAGILLTGEPVLMKIVNTPIRGDWSIVGAGKTIKENIRELYVEDEKSGDGNGEAGTISEAAYSSPYSFLYVAPGHVPAKNPVTLRADVQTAAGLITVESDVYIGQDISMNSTVGTLINPLSVFTAAEGGVLTVAAWSDTDPAKANGVEVSIKKFIKDKLEYSAGPDVEFRLTGDNSVYRSTYYTKDVNGVRIPKYGNATLHVESIVALPEHPGMAILTGSIDATVFRPVGGDNYEKGTVAARFRIIGTYLP
jgi:hypothetical protein